MVTRLFSIRWIWAVFIAVSFMLSSCNKEALDPPDKEGKVSEVIQTDEVSAVKEPSKTLLGKKLENPYSITNMKKALAHLQSTKGRNFVSSGKGDIQVTDYYIRFLPKSAEDIEELEADSLHLFEHPLDHEIEEFGDYYPDPKDGKQWLYTSVPVSYELPSNIEYEVLEELYLGDKDNGENGLVARSSFFEELEEVSLRLTGNWEEELDTRSPNRRRVPKGYVRVYDDLKRGLVGVEGVKVRTRRWFYYGTGWTNSKGAYTINTWYTGRIYYTVYFDNKLGFKQWNTMVNIQTARHYVGYNSHRGKNIDLHKNSRAWRFATVNNAVLQYRKYCDKFGILKPVTNLRIATLDRRGGSAAPMLRSTWGKYELTSHSRLASFFSSLSLPGVLANTLGNVTKFIQPDIVISAASSIGTFNVNAIVYHELAHASHHRQVGNRYWVDYINYIITHQGYGDGKGRNAGVCGIGEMWGYYFSALCMRDELGDKTPYSDGWYWFREDRDWYNPGFLKHVNGISDVSTRDIFSTLTRDNRTFNTLKYKLKTKTQYDEQVEQAWNRFTDWP